MKNIRQKEKDRGWDKFEDDNDENNQENDNNWDKANSGSDWERKSRKQNNNQQDQSNHEVDRKNILSMSGDGTNDAPSSQNSRYGSKQNKNGREKEYWSRAVERETCDKPQSLYVLPPLPLYSVPENKIKDGARYQIRAGSGQEVKRKLVDVNRWDTWDNPYAVFTFKYRPRGKLNVFS
jgi:hypothetical protein